MKIRLAQAILLLTTLLLMLAVPVWLGGKEVILLITRIPPYFMAALLLLTLLKWAFLTWRWQYLLATEGHGIKKRNIFPIVLASDFISENTPTHVGTMASNILFFKREAVPAMATTAYCNLIFMLDLAAVFLLMSVCLLFSLKTGSNLLWLTTGGIFLTISTLGVLALGLRHLDTLTRHTSQLPISYLIPVRYQSKMLYALFRLKKHLKKTAHLPLRQLIPLFLFSLAHWSIRFSLLFLALLAVGAKASFAPTALIQFVSGLAGMMTFLPAGFPGMDISVGALLHTSQPMAIILPTLLLWRLSTYHVNVLAGGIAFLWMSNKLLKTPRIQAEP